MKLIPTTRTACFNYSILGIFIILIGIFLIFMPKYWDDYDYMKHFAYWYHQQDIPDASQGGNIFTAGIPWDAIKQTWQERWLLDNIRFGNLFATIMLLFPKWLGSSISLLVWVFSMFFSFRIAGINVRNSPIVSLAIIAWSIFIAWSSHIGTLIFQYNYILATGVTLFLLSLLKISDPHYQNQINKNWWMPLIVFFAALLTGWWHEGFSIPVLCGIAGLFALYKSCRNRIYIMAILGLCLGITLLLVAPGTSCRIGAAIENNNSKFLTILAYNIPYYVLLFISIFYILRNGIIDFIKHNLWVFCIISGIIPILISWVTLTEARVTWYTQIISIIGLMNYAKESKISFFNFYNWKNLIFIIPILLLCYIRFGVSDFYVFKFHNMMSKAIREYVSHPDKPIFTKVWTINDIPIITGKLPDIKITNRLLAVAIFLSQWNKDSDNQKYNFVIIPEELKYINNKAGSKIPGDLNVSEYGGRIFKKASKNEYPNYHLFWFLVKFGDKVKLVPAYSFNFISEADGNNYVYFNLMPSLLDSHFYSIQEINKIE